MKFIKKYYKEYFFYFNHCKSFGFVFSIFYVTCAKRGVNVLCGDRKHATRTSCINLCVDGELIRAEIKKYKTLDEIVIKTAQFFLRDRLSPSL